MSSTKSWAEELQKGYLKLLILMLLSQKPLHGYEIMNKIEERTLGFWRPTAGGVYPVLKRMEKNKLVISKWVKFKDKHRKVYEITSKGRDFINKALEKQKIIFDTIEKLRSEFVSEFMEIPPEKIPKHPSFLSLFSIGEKPLTLKQKVKRLTKIKKQLEDIIEKMETYLAEVNQKIEELEKQTKTLPQTKRYIKKQ
ncbi:hypothetical protein DRO26_00715 [Candidatus Bathyarchaeota archaeon]|nr:MAG: hypothetical protein DRO26_00715 [Candidatus Bathyarchaeota archaeon]